MTTRDEDAEGGDEPLRIDPADVAYLASHPSLAHRRMHFDLGELTGMIMEVLAKHGLPVSVVSQSQWIWANTRSGTPELILILPGAKA